jgi:threonine synthase
VKVSYRCVTCGASFESDQVVYECPTCIVPGAAAQGTEIAGFPRGYLAVDVALPAHSRPGLLVDPFSLLPLPIFDWRSFPAGETPLVQPQRLRNATGFRNLFLKNDTLNPSGSLKDRASLLVAAQARRHGVTRVALASTGNAGASMSCAGAAYGLEIILFVPAAAPRAKLLQSLLYGARVVPVQGTYDDAYTLSIAYTRRFGGINRNTAFNPFTVEGKKTVSIEMYNQLGGAAPDIVYVPTGDGVIVSGVCKGFADLHRAGFTDRMPVIVAVQAEGSDAIFRSMRDGRETVLDRTSTIADSLAVSRPAAGAMALQLLKKHGRAIEVSDSETSAAQAELCRESGIFVEPSSAVAWAGFRKDREKVDPAARVVVLLTGTGFKDTAAAEKLVSLPAPCPPDLDSAAGLLADVYGVRGGR